MEIAKISIDKIHAAAYNPRKDLQPGDAEYDNLEHSIERFGYVDPIVWNKRTGNIVGGHQRYKILLSQGHTEIEVSVVDLSDEEEKAFNVALNKIGGQWDDEKLSELLREISNSDIDVLITGFDDIELDSMLNSNIGDDLSGFFKESQTTEKFPKMTVCPFCFDSVDSTSWTSGNRFGAIYTFDGKTMRKTSVPKGMRLADSHETAIRNFNEWVKFQKYAEKHL